MAGIGRFEEIEAWKEARALTSEIYGASAGGAFGSDFGLRDQARRAAVSIMANIAEGFESGSNGEFLRFLGYARRSATELQSHLYVARDQDYLDDQRFAELYDRAALVIRLVGGFMRYLRTTPNPNPRTANPNPRTANPNL